MSHAEDITPVTGAAVSTRNQAQSRGGTQGSGLRRNKAASSTNRSSVAISQTLSTGGLSYDGRPRFFRGLHENRPAASRKQAAAANSAEPGKAGTAPALGVDVGVLVGPDGVVVMLGDHARHATGVCSVDVPVRGELIEELRGGGRGDDALVQCRATGLAGRPGRRCRGRAAPARLTPCPRRG